jgi:hypothetical protein
MTLPDLKQIALSFLRARQRDYFQTFNNPVAQRVLADLAKFCRAHKSTGNPDPYVAARLDGRREVFLRISSHLNLSEKQMWEMYGKDATK